MQLGVSSAATQIEGGDYSHSWNDWYQKGRIHDGSNPARACDHLNRWKEDIDIMAELGITIYRLGMEWARLEPVQGSYNDDAVQWYRQLLLYIKGKGITPLLTIHHFTNPMWFESLGGFAAAENIPVYLSFVEFVIRNFGDLVDEYVTINEPNVFAVLGYFQGLFPPGQRSMGAAFHVQSVLAGCHIQAYSLIHKLRSEMGYTNTKVGFAHHARVFSPKSKWNLWHRLCSTLVARFFQGAVTRACLLGRFVFPLKNICKMPGGEYADFLGLNYYTRSAVSGLGDGVAEGVPVNDLGWEIYPQGIAECAGELYSLLKRPIYITENGTCDNNDNFRSRYIYEHIKALSESDLPVERYYHWCFTDNFEWCEGESARFGLVHVDYESQKRTIKKSGEFYKAMIKYNGITDEIYKNYLTQEKYHYGNIKT